MALNEAKKRWESKEDEGGQSAPAAPAPRKFAALASVIKT